jgi:HMG (high mobility group) box
LITSDHNDETGQVGKVLGDKWKALSEKDRKPYEDKAKKDKERYEEEKIAYQNVCHLIYHGSRESI